MSLRGWWWAGALAAATAGPLAAQIPFSSESFHEIEGLEVRADIQGALPEAATVARILEEAIRAELRRAEIRLPGADGRRDFCCLLRLDVRVITTPARFRGATAFSLRLELARTDASFGYPVWITYWASKHATGFFEQSELLEALRHAAKDAADEFVDRFRERFPI